MGGEWSLVRGLKSVVEHWLLKTRCRAAAPVFYQKQRMCIEGNKQQPRFAYSHEGAWITIGAP